MLSLRQGRPPGPVEVSLSISPDTSVQLLDVSAAARTQEITPDYPRVYYSTLHTTAGYFEQKTAKALGIREGGISAYLQRYLSLFPPDAGYHHDALHLRPELSREQRETEPKNAHSHLAYIASGLSSCVRYVNRPRDPVYLVELDGVYGGMRRKRTVRIVGYSGEEAVAQKHWTVPIIGPDMCIDLSASSFRLFEQLAQMVRSHTVTKGRVLLSLAAAVPNAALTVNEYEPLLIIRDLGSVLKRQATFHKHNDALSALVLRRQVSLLISDHDTPGFGHVIRGQYQSPILMTLGRPIAKSIALTATVLRFV